MNEAVVNFYVQVCGDMDFLEMYLLSLGGSIYKIF